MNYPEDFVNKIIHGDCLDVMKDIPDNSIDLVITSPPYAQRREGTYGGVNENEYVEWFLPIAAEIRRLIKPSGSFFLNIKPHTKNGERSLYVFDLICSIKRGLDLFFVDEFCWTKNPFMGGYKGRFKNAFEPVYHFTKSHPRSIVFNPIACGTPTKEESTKRAYRKQCGAPENGSGMTGMNTQNMRHIKISRPSNVIAANNVVNQFMPKKGHPATYPEALVDFFIRSFTRDGHLVLDPFVGSGTTAIVAKKLGRDFIGIDSTEKYCAIAKEMLAMVE